MDDSVENCASCKFCIVRSITGGYVPTAQRETAAPDHRIAWARYCRRYPTYIKKEGTDWCGEWKKQ